MRKIFLLMTVLSFLFNGPLRANERENEYDHETVMKYLSVNRSLLARYEAEEKTPDVETKIRVLKEDSQRLLSALPEKARAYEFLKDLAAKRSFIPPAPSMRPKKKHGEGVNRLHEKALEFVSQNKMDDAVKLYEEIVLAEPNDDEAYLIMGHCYVLLGRYEKAEAAFKNAVGIDPEDARDIAPFYENIVMQNPSDDLAYANLGYAYLVVGQLPKAKAAFRDSLSINPDNDVALTGLKVIENQSRL